jgi:hypothetical protein
MKTARFDWYQATVQESPEAVASWSKQVWPDGIMRPCKPKNGTSDAFQMCLGELVVMTAMWGGGMEGHGVNIFATGCDAPFFASQVRRKWPIHRVTRADVAIDFNGPGAWQWGFNLLSGIADEYKIKTRHEGDYHRAEDGRSFYLGGRQSVVRGVIYEKGKQIPELGMPNLVRIELRIFPKDRESGELVARVEPAMLYGCSKWSAALGAYLASDETMERVVIGTRWNKSDRAKAIRALVKQYGGHLGELCGELGGWDELGLHLGELIREAATIKNRLIEDTKKIRKGQSIKPYEPKQEVVQTVEGW